MCRCNDTKVHENSPPHAPLSSAPSAAGAEETPGASVCSECTALKKKGGSKRNPWDGHAQIMESKLLEFSVFGDLPP